MHAGGQVGLRLPRLIQTKYCIQLNRKAVRQFSLHVSGLKEASGAFLLVLVYTFLSCMGRRENGMCVRSEWDSHVQD